MPRFRVALAKANAKASLDAKRSAKASKKGRGSSRHASPERPPGDRDGDGDGWLHDHTAREMPAPARQAPAKAGKAPKSAGTSKPRAARGEMADAKRVGSGKDAKLVMADGSPAPPHVKATLVPPQWTDVKISRDPKADVLVTARDAAGRGKTVYSDSFAAKTAANKFERVHELVAKAPAIHAQNQANRASKDHATKEAADCTYLIERQGTRPGSDKDVGARVKAYGATTLRAEHVVVDGSETRLKFIGKEGVAHDHKINDPKLAAMLKERAANAKDRGGKLFDVNETKLNGYIKTLDGGRFTAKDFRTSLATRMAIKETAKQPPPKDEKQYRKAAMRVAKIVSKKLGNEPVQALESYISPAAFDHWRMHR